MKKKILVNLLILFTVTFPNINNKKVIGSGKQYLIEDINLNIMSFENSKMKICEYKIDKFNNLISINVDESSAKLFKIESDFYSLNDTIYKELDEDIYIFWLDRDIELKKDGLYVDDRLYLLDNEVEKIYLIEYSSEYKKIKIPLILKKDIIIGDKVLEDTDTLKIFSKERKLKDIEFFDLFNFIEYLNKIDKCY